MKAREWESFPKVATALWILVVIGFGVLFAIKLGLFYGAVSSLSSWCRWVSVLGY